MAKDLRSINIRDLPDVLRIAEEVAESGESRMLRRDGDELAVLSPVHRQRRPKRTREAADRNAFLLTAGGWKGLVDTEKLKRDIAESRRMSTRPAVEL